MVDVVSRIKMLFTSQGADKAAKQTEKVGRAQTRLGQASASAGRQFSAQASGMGGLVTVYAGAAANIFAITMAFNALAKAAQAEQVIQGTRTLAQEIGASGDQILEKIGQITKGQLSIVDTATQVNAALSAGFNQEQIERLTVVSLKASRALGRDLTDSFGRLVRGAAKLEPELIDELGIFTRIIPATEAYAAANNVAASSLTNYEKRQAFVNAIITEGEDKFQEINTSSKSTQESFERLLASVKDLATGFGQFVATVLTPIVDFFGGSIGNKIILFGAIGALVFGKLRQVVGGFVGETLQKLNLSLDATFAKMSIGGRKAGADLAASFATAKKASKGTRITQGDFGGNAAELRTRQAAIKRLVTTQNLGYRQAADGAKLAEKQIAQLTAAGKTNTVQYKFADQASKAFTAQTGMMGRVAKLAIPGIAGLSVAIRGVGIAISTLMPILMAIMIAFTTIQVVLSMFGLDLIGGIVDAFKQWGRASKELRLGLQSLNEQFASMGGVNDQMAAKMGASSQQVEDASKSSMKAFEKEIEKSKELLQAREALESAMVRISAAGYTLEQATTGAIPFAPDIRTESVLAETKAQEQARMNVVTLEDRSAASTFNAAKANNSLENSIISLRAESVKLAQQAHLTANSELALTAIMLESQAVFLETGKSLYTDYRAMVLIGGQMRLLGMSTASISKAFEVFRGNLDDVLAPLTFGTIQIGKYTKLGYQFTEFYKKTALAISLAAGAQARFIDRNEKGTLNAEKSAQAYGAMATSVAKAKQELREAYGVISDNWVYKKLQEDLAAVDKQFEADIIESKRLMESLKSIEQIGKNIRTVYGSAFKSLDQLYIKGIVNLDGVIAKDAKQKAAFAGQALISAAGFENDLSGAGEKNLRLAGRLADAQADGNEELVKEIQYKLNLNRLNSEQVAQLMVMNSARKAIVSQIIKAAEESEKLVKTQEKAVRVAEQQNSIAQHRITILREQEKVSDLKEAHKLQQEMSRQSIDFLKEQNKLREVGYKAITGQIELDKKRLSILKDNLAVARQLAVATRARITTEKEFLAERRLMRAEGALAEEELMGSMTSPARLREAQSKVDEIKFKNTMNALQEEENLIFLKAKQAREDLSREHYALQIELELNRRQKEIIDEKLISDWQILDAEYALEKQKTSQRKEEIEAERGVITAQRAMAQTQADINYNNRAVALKVLRDQITYLKARTNVDDAYISALGKYLMGAAKLVKAQEALAGKETSEEVRDAEAAGTKLAQGFKDQVDSNIRTLEKSHARQSVLSQEAFTKDITLAEIRERMATKALDNETSRLNSLKTLQDQRYEYRLTALIDQAAIENSLNEVEKEGIRSKLANYDLEDERIREQTIADLMALEIKRDAAEEIIRLARLTAQVEKDLIFQIGESINSLLQDKIGQGIRDLNKAFLDGTITMDNFKEGLRDFAVGILRGIQETIIEKAIVEPVQDLIGEVMGDLFGFGEKGTDMNPMVVRFGFGHSLMDSAAGGAASGGTASGAGGDIISEVFSGTVDWFRGLFSGGGSVQRFAAGGGVMHRDRVPALLEPGEFVIRKPMAKAIGGPALGRMNATGQMPAGNIEINMVNKGTPQQATSEQKPQIDGKGIIIDIVLTDLQNNGPIKQAIRGGGRR